MARKLGEAMINSSSLPKALEGYILEDALVRELTGNVFERAPFHWGHGPYEQNRRLGALTKRSEGGQV